MTGGARHRASSAAGAAAAVVVLAVIAALVPVAGAAAQDTETGGTQAFDAIVPEVRAQLVPVRRTVLASEMAGQIDMLEIRDGERFESGQVLAEFDCAEQRARRSVAAATRQRAAKVFENRDRLSRLDGIAEIEKEIAEADLSEANAELHLRNVLLGRCTVKAPFAGVVADVRAQAHQYVGEGEPLLEIVDDGAFEVEMLLPSHWLRGLVLGQAFSLEIDETGRTYQAELLRLSGKIDPVSQSLKAYGGIVDPGPDLRAGMSGRALFRLAN